MATGLRSRFLIGLLTFATASACAVWILVVSAAGSSAAAGRSCDDILSAHAFFSVTIERGSVSCASARRVLTILMGGGGVKHGGPYAYQQWSSVGDWRCGFGAGGAVCSLPASRNHGSARAEAEWLAWECGHKPGGTVPCADTPNDAVKTIVRERFRVPPLWPTYLPAEVRDGTWWVSDLRGVQQYPAYPDPTASGRMAFRVDYGYMVMPGASGGGAFSRTSPKALLPAIRASRVNFVPRHLRLGSRDVVEFRLGSTATEWAFSGPGGYYVFTSKDYGGPSEATIGRIIASMRSIVQLGR